ncbi:MAG: hypothetical protein CME59_13195 [Halioglobus sp.]|nr:hypothetical protein [Halioglobus sp.]|tara:strand:+ start:6358 stop:7461 length:1104 start_codon:yes stop_codon:yes gene_type:complete
MTGLATISAPALAGAKLEIDETKWVSIGAGIRTHAKWTEDGAPSGEDDGWDFDVENMRLYMAGQVHEYIKFTFNTDEIFGDGPVDVLDAIVQVELSPEFNLWMGRMLTPADRIEMNGPFYSMTWNQYTQPLYPSDQGGDAGQYGRDDGLTVWGAFGKFQYAIGAFDGLEGKSNQEDNLLFAGRFAYNILNMESNPGYYTSSSYYGGLGNILTVAVSFQSQDGGSGSEQDSGDFSGYTVDVFSETVFDGGGVLNLEGEFKDFDADYTVATTPEEGDCFCLFEGTSYFFTAGYLFPQDVGPGKFQPYARYVVNDPDDSDDSDLTELGVNYVIDGFNAKLNLNYNTGDANISGYQGADVDSVSFGIQVQI